MNWSTLSNKILPVIFFMAMLYYMYYFKLFPFDQLFENIKSYLPEPVSKQLTTKLSPARNLEGRWVGNGPQGAFYKDNVANPACAYEADIVLDIENQTGNDIAGFISFRVRKSNQILRRIPCIPEGVMAINQAPIKGTISSTYVSFENPGLPGSFSPISFTTAKGTFTSDLMSGTFERSPNSSGGGDLTGIIGKWSVSRSR